MNEMDTRFANQYNIQWFPGHMTKTLRMMEQEIQHVDASLVLLDARIPLSSLNPEIERITDRKPKLYALNKADLADPAVTEEWIRYFHAAEAGCVAISAKQKGGANAVKVAIEKELSGLLERRQNRGMGGAKTQVMLCGIPNVGKSTFINTFAGSARAKAADRPGVTKGKQWVSTEKFDLLDMPGVLWKKFDSKTIASNLAFIGSIKDDILDVEELAMNLLDEVRRNYPDLVAQRYKLDAETLALPPYELLEAIGRKRGLLVRGGEVNTERCAIMLVDEFRACKWGRISLERPPQRDDLADFAGVAACILDPENPVYGINDSKKLTEKKREALFDEICEKALAYRIVFVGPEVIDRENILNATMGGMQQAVEELDIVPNLVLVDGNRTPAGLQIPAQPVVKGDATSASIGAASVLAKVSRDRYMLELDKQYPQYQLAKHKGYPTKLHYELIAQYGIQPFYRRSFLKKQGYWPESGK